MPITITNGTVSRTIKPADYEARTVALSFTVDDSDDIDEGLARVSALAEKHARAMPGAVKAAPVTTPVQEKPVDALASAGLPTVGVLAYDPPTGPYVPTVPHAEPEPIVITDEQLTKACQEATQRAKDPQPTKDVIAKFVEKPGMRAHTIPQEQRASFLEALKFVGGHAADY
jgi:hypothetical protein